MGEVVSTCTEEKYLTDGAVEFKNTKPFILSMNDRQYHALSEPKAKAWNADKNKP
jgi:hypothetical protein